MTVTTTQFQIMIDALDARVLKTDADLLGRPSVRKRLRLISNFCRELKEVSPESFNRLKDERRETAARHPSHIVAMEKARDDLDVAETSVRRKIVQIRVSMWRNLAAHHELATALAFLKEVTAYEALAKSQAERAELHFALEAEVARLKADGAKAERDALKETQASTLADAERVTKLDRQIEDLRTKLRSTHGDLDAVYAETDRLIAFLTDQQKKRDQNKADEIERQKWAPTAETSTVAGLDNEDGTPIEFEDVSLDRLPADAHKNEMVVVYRWASENDLPIKNDDDFAAARALYEAAHA